MYILKITNIILTFLHNYNNFYNIFFIVFLCLKNASYNPIKIKNKKSIIDIHLLFCTHCT